DPDQQCRDRRSRLYLHRRSRQHRPAYPGTRRRRPRRRRPAVTERTMRRLPVIAAAVLAIGALSAVAAVQYAPPREAPKSRWQEIAWPFPRDGWPAGRAFRCDGASCGGEVELYVRPKIGFCNCDKGVADDDEVDRVIDLDLISERFAPLE